MHRTRLILLLAAFGCSESPSSTKGLSTVTSLSLTPGNIRLSSGESQEVTCTARDGGGNPTALPAVTWLVADARIALVEETEANDRGRRRITGTGIGTAQIGCRFAGITATTSVAVVPFTVTLTPPADTISVGQTITVTAAVTRENGSSVPFLSPLNVTWSASPTGRVTVTAGSTPGTATVTALTPGFATVNATLRGFTDFGVLGAQSLGVTVLPPP